MRSLTFSFMGLILACSPAVTVAHGPVAPGASQSNRDRIVRVVTISQEDLQFGTNDRMEPTLARLNRAASFHPDIACLPEVFSGHAPEHVPGPITERLTAWAREHSSYVIFGLKTKKGDRVYNSAILLDRKGEIIGQYNEIHPPDKELKEGTTAGEDVGPPIFKTDFGMIGIQICYDVNWPDEWRHLKEQGAQIVFWPAGYPAERQLPALASLNHYYIISSTERGSAHIYDITGEALATSGKYQDWAEAVLPLGKRLFEVVGAASKAYEIQQKYGSRVEVTWYHESDWVTLTSLDPNLSVEDLITEYGLTPLDEEIARSTRLINQARAEADGRPQADK